MVGGGGGAYKRRFTVLRSCEGWGVLEVGTSLILGVSFENEGGYEGLAFYLKNVKPYYKANPCSFL